MRNLKILTLITVLSTFLTANLWAECNCKSKSGAHASKPVEQVEVTAEDMDDELENFEG